jgi:DNA-binding CsgD family transcriptional regulator
LALASSLQPLWQARGRLREGLVWFDAALAGLDTCHPGVAPAVCARALADRAMLANWVGAAGSLDQAQQALAIAREVADPAVLARALTACGYTAIVQKAEVAGPYFAEALTLARALGDRWRLSQILACQARGAIFVGDPIAARAAGQEGCDLADAIGDWWTSRQCRWCLGMAQLFQGDLARAAAQLGSVAAGAEAAHDGFFEAYGLAFQGIALAYQGETGAARAVADAALDAAGELGGIAAGLADHAVGGAVLAAGDPAAALDATESAWQHLSVVPAMAGTHHAFSAQAALAGGDLLAARRWADDAVTTATGWLLMSALTTRTRVAIAQGELDQAERDAHDALACAADVEAYLGISDTLECLAALAGDACSHREAARLFGAAHAIRQRIGAVRFKIWNAGYEASVAAVRDALGDKDFDSAWTDGAALSTEEAIAYAQRGRGERKRPTSGWGALTPTERHVIRLVSEGLGNKDIAARLFVSPRTVQTHLTHVYTKLGLTSRVQLVQEAAGHT